ncbi:MAG: hypothetical protein HFJ54_00025 [Clostridia bacterium]|nr:hypothetical protein [Clostridia bacterium]
MIRAFKEEKTKFLSKYFDELPKNIQMEAVIKFNDLEIPEDKIQKLLKK